MIIETGGPRVIDSKALREVIIDSGIKSIHIANNLGITHHSLMNKLDGKTDFWWHEVISLNKILRLTPDEFKKIFGP